MNVNAHTRQVHTHSLSTDALWELTHHTLLAGKWSVARAYLDDLGRRADCKDSLCTIHTYIKDAGVTGDYKDTLVSLLGDRIALVNTKVMNGR